ncbi:hypothetical protein N7451_003107 [Penicillium sp. IBT 35674x]|nr:hypothetical protein N7451_003107 [Penicillium sp. IBT 35674x]
MVPVSQLIDLRSLEQYLLQNVRDIRIPFGLKQFGFGQSNPTYEITDATGRKFVLRKKPPGNLISKSAHKIEREYRVLRSLEHSDVPVPMTYALCEDESVIGTPFYIMEFLDGRIFEDPTFPEVAPAERRALYEDRTYTKVALWHEAVIVLARLHRLQPNKLRLQTFGKPENFYNRQIQTWKGLEASQKSIADKETGKLVGPVPGMAEMLHFLGARNFQPKDRASLIHGDYKIDNLVYHKTRPEIIGILDWEMSTIGHPLSDLSNLLHPFVVSSYSSALAEKLLYPPSPYSDFPGLPTIHEVVSWYREVAGWDPEPDMQWADAFTVFRAAVIRQGIAARFANRQASSETAFQYGEGMGPMASLALNIIDELKSGARHLERL